ncbi:divergent polysaccharide deacetylase family protein [Thalassospira sp.]|uniref:divergent polysaccharide deacetylase family protein n=1 Tax=Thalassospira sp. TaxID=1912094 RepID=UPI0027363F9A|nr:divergent polysaccharide deacetylase family protein [Thalassospira sp.]MDP2699578.1 divergent polysaccharide deacetylase family protein [Thalassospira sp.]
MIGKLIKSLRFRRNKETSPFDDDMDVSPSGGEDLPFTELPYDLQYQLLPKHPPSRRWNLSKALLVVLLFLPFLVLSFGAIPVIDPETGWRLFHAGSPRSTVAIPGTERELQDEIAQGVLDMEARARAAQERIDDATASGEAPSEADLAAVADLMGAPPPEDTGEDGAGETTEGEVFTPEQLAAMADEGGLDEPITPDPLRPAPFPGLDTAGSFGRIPKIGDDGTTPARAYARPFELVENQPYVAVIVTGLGMNRERTDTAIRELPLNISLGLSPYGPDLPQTAAAAREMGHEVFLQMPMEPDDFPLSDPGPRALMTGLSEGENLVRLEWLLSRFPGYVGVISHLGSKFSNLDTGIRPVIQFINQSGLMYVDGGTTVSVSLAAQLAANAGAPNAISNIVIDEVPSRRYIDDRLNDLVAQAKRNGVAVGIAGSYPVTIQRLRNWSLRLERQGVKLAPISAISSRQVAAQSTAEADAARAAARAEQESTPAETAADEDTIEGN